MNGSKKPGDGELISMRKELLVFGCGGHSKVIIDLIEHVPQFHVFGLIDENPKRPSHFQGYPVLGDISWLGDLKNHPSRGVIAIGDNWTRRKVMERIDQIVPNFEFVTLIHPTAHVSPRCQIGEGSVVFCGAIVNSDVTIGKQVIVNSLGSVAHDSVIGDFSSIGPGTHLGGNTVVGENSAIALGARVLHGMTIGDHTVIGAGATVTKPFGDYEVAYGSPAKFIRKRSKEEIYL